MLFDILAIISLSHLSFLQSVHQFVDCRKRSTDPSVSDRWNGKQLGLSVPQRLCQSLCQLVSPSYGGQSWISALWWHCCHWCAQRISLWQRRPCTAGHGLDTHHTSFLIDSRAQCTDFPVCFWTSTQSMQQHKDMKLGFLLFNCVQFDNLIMQQEGRHDFRPCLKCKYLLLLPSVPLDLLGLVQHFKLLHVRLFIIF